MSKPGANSDWKKPKGRDAIRATVYSFKAAWKHARLPFVGRIISSTIQGVMPGAQVYVLAAAIRAIEESRGFGNAAGAMFVVWGAIAIIEHLSARLGHVASNCLDRDLRPSQAAAFYAAVERTPLESFEEPEFHDRVRWGSAGVRSVSALASNFLWGVLQSGLGAVGLLVQLALTSPILAGLVAVVAVPSRILANRFNRDALLARFGWTSTMRKAAYWEQLLTRRESQAEIQHLGLADEGLRRWDEAKSEMLGEQAKTESKAFYRLSGLQLVDACILLVLLMWVGRSSAAGTIGPAAIVAGIYALQSIGRQLRQFDSGLRMWWHTLVPVNCMVHLIRAQNPADSSPEPIGLFSRIEMQNVGFRYPTAAGDALHATDVTLEVGKSYAVVGQNGAGKSTFVKVLCGLYTPSEGEILLDGRRLAGRDRRRLCDSTSMAFQESLRIPTTLRENLTAGRDLPDEAVSQIASLCGIDELIQSLPDGWDTELGKATAGSVDISSGQWQRVSLGRCLLKPARLVVFDEPASAQDPLSELNLYRGVVKRDPSRVTVVVSHRLAVATLTDEVLYFDGGRIAAKGSHSEVMRTCPDYAAGFEEQAKLYLEASNA